MVILGALNVLDNLLVGLFLPSLFSMEIANFHLFINQILGLHERSNESFTLLSFQSSHFGSMDDICDF